MDEWMDVERDTDRHRSDTPGNNYLVKCEREEERESESFSILFVVEFN